MKKILYPLIGILIVIAAIFIALAFIDSQKQPKHNSQKKMDLYVLTKDVAYKDNSIIANYRGRVLSSNNIALSAEVSGKILKGDIDLKAGADFKKDDILFKIYDEDVVASLQAQKSTFLQILASILPDIKVDYPDQYDVWYDFFDKFDINKTLPKLPSYSSDKEKVFLASKGLLAAYYNLAQKEITLSKYIVRAPFDGSLTSVSKEVGNVTSMGSQIATMIRNSKLEVTVPVFPRDLGWVKNSSTIEIVTSRNNKIFGNIERVASYVDETTQSVNVYVGVKNITDNYLLQGEYVDVIFKGDNIRGMEVPRESIVDKEYMYILKDHSLVKKKIKIIEKSNDSYIISGLEPGEKAVVESISKIEPLVKYLSRK